MRSGLKLKPSESGPGQNSVKRRRVASKSIWIPKEQGAARQGTGSRGAIEPENGSPAGDMDACTARQETVESAGDIEQSTGDGTTIPLNLSDELFERAIHAAGKVLARS